MISVRGSKNFRNPDEGKNILNGVSTKVETRNQVPNIQNVKPMKSARDNVANENLINKRESLP